MHKISNLVCVDKGSIWKKEIDLSPHVAIILSVSFLFISPVFMIFLPRIISPLIAMLFVFISNFLLLVITLASLTTLLNKCLFFKVGKLKGVRIYSIKILLLSVLYLILISIGLVMLISVSPNFF